MLAAVVFIAAAGLGVVAGGAKGPAVAPAVLVVDPNTAAPGVLLALPRLGPTLVDRIVEARRRAPFRSIEDFDARVRGIGPVTIEALRPYLRIEGEGVGPN